MRLTRHAIAIPGHAVHGDAWPAWVGAGQRRRQDPLVRAACAAVERLLAQGPALPTDTAVVTATAYGAVESTFRFAQSIASYGDAGASPTPFTTSVHNSCAGALGEFLHLHGPSTTVSQGCTSTVSALRWATLMLAAGRAPAVLLVAGERHNDWSRGVVGALSHATWPIGDGVVACVIEPGDGAGRELRLGAHPAPLQIDGGTPDQLDEQLLASSAKGRTRRSAPEYLGAWWPTATLAALDWANDGAVGLSEAEGGRCEHAWLSPLA